MTQTCFWLYGGCSQYNNGYIVINWFISCSKCSERKVWETIQNLRETQGPIMEVRKVFPKDFLSHVMGVGRTGPPARRRLEARVWAKILAQRGHGGSQEPRAFGSTESKHKGQFCQMVLESQADHQGCDKDFGHILRALGTHWSKHH